MKMYTIHFDIYQDMNVLYDAIKMGWWSESEASAEMDFMDFFAPMFDWIELNGYSFYIYVEVTA